MTDSDYQYQYDRKVILFNEAISSFTNEIDYFPSKKVNIIPISTKEINPSADRPVQGGLKTGKFLSEYPDFKYSNVDDFLNEIKSEL